MSKLSVTAVYSKPIERQHVSTCLKVFSEETATVLELYERQHCIDVTGTVTFIRKVLKWWTIINVKNKGMDLQKRQPHQAVISHPDDPRLQFIEEYWEMCLNMSGRQGKREKRLSKDTAVALFQTCNGIVELTKNLLQQLRRL